MKKCYIAGKIGDLPIEIYARLFKDGAKEVEQMGFEALSPIDLPHNHDKTWRSYMIEDLRLMVGCDAVYALKNWTHSPGARIEVGLAVQLGIEIIYQK